MSHLVTVATKVRDPAAITAACRRLGIAEPVHGTAQLFNGAATGLLLRLPGWVYPAIIDPLSGSIVYDIFEGAWGDQRHIDRFLQAYAVERAILEARKKGLQYSEQSLEDGSIKLEITENP